MSVLKIKKFTENAYIPCKANADDAGYDLSSIEKVTIAPNTGKLINTGIGITVPPGTYGRIAPRSGVSTKSILVNAGVVDRTYTGVVKVLLFNLSNVDFEVDVGNRIAQLILEKIETNVHVEIVEELETTSRGDGGFGSTGV